MVFENQELTYQQLNEKANQLAHYLRKLYDVKPDTLIALCLDRSEIMLISILGILKAGGAYVPIDPNYPDNRIQYILNNTNTQLLLTGEIYQQRLDRLGRPSHVKTLAVDCLETQMGLTSQPLNNPITETKNSHLAYVMYTSGNHWKSERRYA